MAMVRSRRRLKPLPGKIDRKSTRLNSHSQISYAVFCLKKKIADALLARDSIEALATRCERKLAAAPPLTPLRSSPPRTEILSSLYHTPKSFHVLLGFLDDHGVTRSSGDDPILVLPPEQGRERVATLSERKKVAQ